MNMQHHTKICPRFSLLEDVFGEMDYKLKVQINEEILYLRKVLHRDVAIILGLTSRGLVGRGHIEKLRSIICNVNFLMCGEMLAQFDPFLYKHLKRNAE